MKNNIRDVEKEIDNINNEIVICDEKMIEISKICDDIKFELSKPKKDGSDYKLSPNILLEFKENNKQEPSEVVIIEHKYRPLIVFYDRDKKGDYNTNVIENIQKFLRNLVIGVLKLNNYNIVNQHVLELDTGGVAVPKELSNLVCTYNSSSKISDLISSMNKIKDDVVIEGSIFELNDRRYKNEEHPYKYNIVYFYAYDKSILNDELIRQILKVEGRLELFQLYL